MTPGQNDALMNAARDADVDGVIAAVNALLAQARAEALEEAANMVDHILREGGGTYGDAIRKLGEPVIQQISEETMAAARRAVIRQDADTRTETEIIRDGASFVMGEKRGHD